MFSTIGCLLRYTLQFLRHRPDAVYLMVTRSKLGCVKDCVVMTLAGWRGVPIVVHVRGGDLGVFFRQLRGFWRWMVNRAYQRVAIGIVLGESLRAQFDGLLPSHQVRVVLNSWLDSDESLRPDRTPRGPKAPLRITFLSNVLPSKGLYDALEGVALAIRQGVKLEFRFAGDFLDHDGAIAKLPGLAKDNLPASSLERKYTELLATLGIEDHVVRLGVIAGASKWELLADTDILLLPIYNPTEGQPLTVIEAMRAGCAIIATACGGLVDITEEGVTGRVVPPRRPDEIGRAIRWFWDHPEELGRIGRDNVKRAEQRHSPKQHVSRMAEILREAIRNRCPVA